MAKIAIEDSRQAFFSGSAKSTPVVRSLTAGASNTTSAALAAGVYRFFCNSNCAYIRQVASNAITAAPSNAFPIAKGIVGELAVDGQDDDFIACYPDSDGALWLQLK